MSKTMNEAKRPSLKDKILAQEKQEAEARKPEKSKKLGQKVKGRK